MREEVNWEHDEVAGIAAVNGIEVIGPRDCAVETRALQQCAHKSVDARRRTSAGCCHVIVWPPWTYCPTGSWSSPRQDWNVPLIAASTDFRSAFCQHPDVRRLGRTVGRRVIGTSYTIIRIWRHQDMVSHYIKPIGIHLQRRLTLAKLGRPRAGWVARLEAEDAAADKVAPLGHLGVGRAAGTVEGARVQERAERVATLVGACRRSG